MSFVSFRKTFFPTGEEMKALEKRMEEIHSKCVEDEEYVDVWAEYEEEMMNEYLATYCTKQEDANGN